MSYEKLISEHARIDAVLDRLHALVTHDDPYVPDVVIALSHLSDELSHHLAHEDSLIYPRMICGTNAEASRVATAFIREFADLTGDWRVYLAEWNVECIAGDWDGFRCATESMIARLARRVHAENQLLYSVALKTNAIHLRERRSNRLAA